MNDKTIENKRIFPNSTFETDFHRIYFPGHEQIVVELLKNGAELNLLNNDKETAAEVATQLGEQEISNILTIFGN